ncbi:MAG: DUF362 domain-containing protein, partial [Promethearchaeota archaeon]
MSDVYFSSVRVEHLEADKTLPAKLMRMLDAIDLNRFVKGKKVCIKMHLGGNLGYTTIHPFFINKIVEKIKQAKPRSIIITDGYKSNWHIRGYTKKTLGAKLVPLFGPGKKTVKVPIGYKTFDEAEIAKLILDADVLFVLSHVKGHGDCGFGGAGKNIAMGCVPSSTRSKIHALEGGIEWDESKCTHCNKCIEECPNKANKFNDKNKYEIFWHNCKFCRHCVLICPQGALVTTGNTFRDFQEGMAHVVKKIHEHFGKENMLFLNFLLNITIFCDCWGFSTPSLVPDIGILASRDLV